MTEQEQNRKINELNRRVTRLEASNKALEQDVEPKGWISAAFEANEREFSEIKQRLFSLETEVRHGFAQTNGKLEAILNHLTGMSDLPEE